MTFFKQKDFSKWNFDWSTNIKDIADIENSFNQNYKNRIWSAQGTVNFNRPFISINLPENLTKTERYLIWALEKLFKNSRIKVDIYGIEKDNYE